MTIEPYAAKSIVRPGQPGLFSWADFYLNPYQGCGHDCRYCDGKSEGYHLHEDFAARIRVKANAVDLLRDFLRRKSFGNIGQTSLFQGPARFLLGIGGGVCDVYQPAERETRATRKLLQLCRDYGYPVAIITKGTAVLHDLDLLSEIAESSYASCSFTITLADDATQAIFEPHASPTSERFRAMRILHEEGVHTGVYLLPALPFIADTRENFRAIFEQAKASGAGFVHCGGLTLKQGRNKQEFFRTLQQHFPKLLPRYRKLYGNNDRYGSPSRDEARRMGLPDPVKLGFRIGWELEMDYAPERPIPAGRLDVNLSASEYLQRIAFVKSRLLGIDREELPLLHKAVQFLERTRHDLEGMKPESVANLPLSEEPLRYVCEYAAGDGSTLRGLEQRAARELAGYKGSEPDQ